VVVAFGLGSGSGHVHCLWSNRFISGIDYYTRREVFESLRIYFISRFCIGLILLIGLWDIAHAAFLQLLACKEPPCDGFEARWISQVSWKYHVLTPAPGCSGPATKFVHFYSVYSTPCVLSTMSEKTLFLRAEFWCRKMSTSNSWPLQHITLHSPEHFQVACPENLALRSVSQLIEPAQHLEFKASQDSVKRLDAFPYLEHIDNICRVIVSTTATSSAMDENICWHWSSTEWLHCWAMGMRHAGFPWDERTKQSILPVRDACRVQIYLLWNPEAGHEDVQWQRTEGRKHHSALPMLQEWEWRPEACG